MVYEQVHAALWKIEEFYREAKGATRIELRQCRTGLAQRDYMACVMLVWSRLEYLARQSRRTVYRVKRGLPHDYLFRQLENPTVKMLLE